MNVLTKDEISPELALKMVQAGIKTRHDAAGLTDTIKEETPRRVELLEGEIPIEESIARQARFAEIARKLEIEMAEKGISMKSLFPNWAKRAKY